MLVHRGAYYPELPNKEPNPRARILASQESAADLGCQGSTVTWQTASGNMGYVGKALSIAATFSSILTLSLCFQNCAENAHLQLWNEGKKTVPSQSKSRRHYRFCYYLISCLDSSVALSSLATSSRRIHFSSVSGGSLRNWSVWAFCSSVCQKRGATT